MKKLLLAALFALALASPAVAQDRPLFSLARLTLAAGVDYSFPEVGPNQLKVGVFGAYNLTPILSLTGSTVYPLETKDFETRVGVRVRVWRGN